MTDIKFYSYSDAYREFSNFWFVAITCPVPWSDTETFSYRSVEHFYQSMKATNENDWRRVASCAKPGQAKRAGRDIVIRENWSSIKDSVMLTGLRAKFSQEPFKSLLLGTGDAILHEDSPHDPYWGIQGQDKLGRLLMQVRDEIRSK